jgi:hypothetical protein
MRSDTGPPPAPRYDQPNCLTPLKNSYKDASQNLIMRFAGGPVIPAEGRGRPGVMPGRTCPAQLQELWRPGLRDAQFLQVHELARDLMPVAPKAENILGMITFPAGNGELE